MIRKVQLVFWVVVWTNVFVFLLLAGKNPFSTRSLIPNLEPYPDTLFYSVPAWNLVRGGGFAMKAFGIQIRNITPPLYSFFMVPFFMLLGDVRSFYFANLFLAVGTILVFALSVREIFGKHKNFYWGLGAILFFLVTNFYFYTLPTLLMAENISLFLATLGLYFFIKQRNTLLAVAGIFLLFVKLSNLPISVVYVSTGFIKILLTRNRIKAIRFLLIVLAFLFFIFIYFWKMEIFTDHKNLEKGVGFSVKYFVKNFSYYVNSFLGGKTVFLWFTHLWLDRVLVVLSMFGLVFGMIKKKTTYNVLWGILVILSLIIFMSFFYTTDSRYLLLVLPFSVLFSGFLFFGGRVKVFFVAVCMIFYLLFDGKIGDLKRQVGLNLRHREDPWNYMALKTWQPYLEKDSESVLATFLPPFYVSLINGEKNGYLPISSFQEFSSGKDNYFVKLYEGSLVDKYRSLLSNGKNIYISDYYVSNNLNQWRRDYEEIVGNFELKLVAEGCLGGCNLYRLE